MEGKKFDTDRMEELLMLYCMGKTTPEECTLVERWIDESDEHLLLAKEIYHTNRAVSDAEVSYRVNSDKALRKVNASLNHRKWYALFRRMEHVAAVLFFPVLLLYLLQLDKKQEIVPTHMVEIRANTGSITRVVLPDSTVVCLNAGSSLCYPQQFHNRIREVALKGEGYFEVTHQPSRPFFVTLPHGIQVEVLGTKFNVDAYTDQPFVATTLVDGHVNFLRKTNGKKVRMEMKAGQKIIYDENTNGLKLYEVDPYAEIAWKDGKLIFNNTPLPEVIHQLEKTFNVHITLGNERLKKYSFTGTFDEQTLEPILESLEISSHILWKYIGTDTTTHRRKLHLYTTGDK